MSKHLVPENANVSLKSFTSQEKWIGNTECESFKHFNRIRAMLRKKLNYCKQYYSQDYHLFDYM